ncbi:FAD/NAD(P)-binding domain-containing protein [Colletotrichum zoysiae]|uniref:FAD/NAD(P)-binding domain-containing protein n=1 Tax=Colletotrichum zoysiae TaxID=1216348 RepID=A0AAD9M0C2_9PEZI|nr:FAD/NAD(P)-binding domain-containing protein [Colletotrichum zoysiae]
MAKLKILICGGGMAGNALAFWLTKQQHDVTVLERFPNLRTTGLQIDIRGYGVEVMKRMGLEQAFRSNAVQEQGLEFVNSTGKQIAYFPTNWSGKGLQGFTTDYEIMRGDLCRIIYDSIEERAKFVFGKTVQSFEQKEGSVEVLFSDGKKEEFDLLVGADGQWSHTRNMMLGPGAPDPVTFLGVYVAYFTVPLQQKEGEEYKGTAYMAPNKRMLFTRRHRPDRIQAYMLSQVASERLQNARKNDVEEEKAAFAEVFRDAGWKSEQFLLWLEASDDFYCERMCIVKMASWSDGRVALLGDAAYCPSAATGMGTSSALVGAYVLAGEIGKHCGNSGSKQAILSALHGYEHKFRPFMEQIQDGITPEAGYWRWQPASLLGIWVLNLLLRLASFFKLNAFAAVNAKEDVKGWSLPDYEGMDCRVQKPGKEQIP